jgi:antitoxin StbD
MTASITELKKSPMDTVLAGRGEAVAILNRNTPAFYCIPADLYENMIEQLEDLELNKIADARANQKRIRVNINEL